MIYYITIFVKVYKNNAKSNQRFEIADCHILTVFQGLLKPEHAQIKSLIKTVAFSLTNQL